MRRPLPAEIVSEQRIEIVVVRTIELTAEARASPGRSGARTGRRGIAEGPPAASVGRQVQEPDYLGEDIAQILPEGARCRGSGSAPGRNTSGTGATARDRAPVARTPARARRLRTGCRRLLPERRRRTPERHRARSIRLRLSRSIGITFRQDPSQVVGSLLAERAEHVPCREGAFHGLPQEHDELQPRVVREDPLRRCWIVQVFRRRLESDPLASEPVGQWEMPVIPCLPPAIEHVLVEVADLFLAARERRSDAERDTCAERPCRPSACR